jgi:hypothetical protein
MSATKTATTETCKAEIIREIERQMRKGRIEGVSFHPCMSCEGPAITENTITVPMTRVSIFGSGVRWKAYSSGSTSKIRK